LKINHLATLLVTDFDDRIISEPSLKAAASSGANPTIVSYNAGVAKILYRHE
jgi:hypothetical protein